MLEGSAFLLLAYLVGSLPAALVGSRLLRLPDPRHYGSGNPGASNVFRGGYRSIAIVILAIDIGKSWLLVWLAHHQQLAAPWPSLVGICVFVGHLYPIFYRFRGGKGVAVAAGILWAIAADIALVASLCWLAIAAITRIPSLASLFSCLLATGLIIWSQPSDSLSIIIMVALILVKHRDNIRELKRGHARRF